MTEYVLTRLETLDAAAVDRVRDIYEEGFAPHLRSDFSTLSTGREDGELALVLQKTGQPSGFAMLRPLGGTGMVFLRYFVVDQHVRGQGLGAIMWGQLTSRLRADGYTTLVFDVEDPDEPGCDEAESLIRSRRIGFYQRLGASLLPVRGYHTPHTDTDSGTEDWVPMLLLAASLTDSPFGDPETIVAAVHQYRWELDPGHPQVAGVRIGGH
jgi:ribosomal protein S18 acetylase RimI-like enzyme